MLRIAFATLAVAAFYAAPASAQYYSGPGYGVHIEPRYEQPYPRRYRHYYRGRDYADPGHPYGYRHNYGDPRCGRPNFTIQDGVCKPYTGR